MRKSNGFLLVAGAGALLVGVLTFGVSLGLAVSAPGGVGGASELPDAVASPGASVDAVAPASTTEVEGQDGAGSSMAFEPAGDALVREAVARDAQVAPEVLRLAVRSAPFEESRRAPARRYELPGNEPPPAPTRAQAPRVEVPEFRLVGSVAMEGRSFALLAVEDDPPQLIAPGESVEGFTLQAVTSEMAVLTGSEQVVRVSMAEPAQTPTRETARGRGNSNQQRGRTNQQNQRAQATSAIQIDDLREAVRAGDIQTLTRAAGQFLGADAAGTPVIQGLIRQFAVPQGGGAAGGGNAQGGPGLGQIIQLFGGGE